MVWNQDRALFVGVADTLSNLITWYRPISELVCTVTIAFQILLQKRSRRWKSEIDKWKFPLLGIGSTLASTNSICVIIGRITSSLWIYAHRRRKPFTFLWRSSPVATVCIRYYFPMQQFTFSISHSKAFTVYSAQNSRRWICLCDVLDARVKSYTWI